MKTKETKLIKLKQEEYSDCYELCNLIKT